MSKDNLIIKTDGQGTTSPNPDFYNVEPGTHNIRQTPDNGWSFSHWEIERESMLSVYGSPNLNLKWKTSIPKRPSFSMDFSSDKSKLIVSASDYGLFSLNTNAEYYCLNTNNGNIVSSYSDGNQDNPTSIAYHPTKNEVVVPQTDHTDSRIDIFDPSTGNRIRRIHVTNNFGKGYRVRNPSFNGDGSKLALTAPGNGIIIIDYETEEVLFEKDMGSNYGRYLDLSDDGKRIVIVYDNSSHDATSIVLWDIENNTRLLRTSATGHSNHAFQKAKLIGDNVIGFKGGSGDDIIVDNENKTTNLRATGLDNDNWPKRNSRHHGAFPGGRYLAIGLAGEDTTWAPWTRPSRDRGIILYDLKNNRKSDEAILLHDVKNGHGHNVHNRKFGYVCFSDDGQYLAVNVRNSSGSNIFLYETGLSTKPL